MAYLNGEQVGSGSDWRKVDKFTVSVVCGSNNLTVVATNWHSGSPAALIFKLGQDQDKCFDCPSSYNYNKNTC